MGKTKSKLEIQSQSCLDIQHLYEKQKKLIKRGTSTSLEFHIHDKFDVVAGFRRGNEATLRRKGRYKARQAKVLCAHPKISE